MNIKNNIKKIIPLYLRRKLNHLPLSTKNSTVASRSGLQDLDVYWDDKMADALEEWGEGNAWSEIEYLLVNCSGKILDIACGTGKNIESLSKFSHIEVHGCDISDFLLERAVARHISQDRLMVCDATKMPYENDSFSCAYSIGSIEHFTEDGIIALVAESYRVARQASFHMLPVSRSGENEGWMKTVQSFHNNSVEWWLDKFHSSYKTVYVLDSKWSDKISVGKWFVCVRGIESC
jgi:ubiquinone/menaquinone biosynthesis C-methylase UbiE